MSHGPPEDFACFLAVAGVSPAIALAITWVGSK